MTKRRRAKQQPRERSQLVPSQVRCQVCRRFHLMGEQCSFCNPPAPAHCHCADSRIEYRPTIDVDLELAPGPHAETCGGHQHIDQALFDRLWQLDLESVDESILLPTEMWDEDAAVARQAWRDDPDYKAWLRRYPQMRERARRGKHSLWSYLELSDLEGEVLDKQAIGYTVDGIAEELGLKPDWTALLLSGAWSKVRARVDRIAREFARVS